MSSPSLRAAIAALAGCALLAGCGPRPLRVCADPNNPPFSNRAGEGFETRVVERLAGQLERPVAYTWYPQRRGFVRNTIKAGLCDVWPGVAVGVETLAVTAPYYRGRYVFVSRADRNLDIRDFDDPKLRRLKIGVQLVGDDGANTPPAHALARRGLTANVRGYMVYGDYATATPAAPIVEAVDRGDVDLAIVWQPVAAYFARRAAHPLRLQPTPERDAGEPMAFDIGLGVRRGDKRLLADLERALAAQRPSVTALIQTYGLSPP